MLGRGLASSERLVPQTDALKKMAGFVVGLKINVRNSF